MKKINELKEIKGMLNVHHHNIKIGDPNYWEIMPLKDAINSLLDIFIDEETLNLKDLSKEDLIDIIQNIDIKVDEIDIRLEEREY